MVVTVARAPDSACVAPGRAGAHKAALMYVDRGKAAVPANGPASNVSQPHPQTGDWVANESGAHSFDLELIEIVMPADFETVTD